MFRRTRTALLIAAVSLLAGLPALAQEFTIECEVLDAQTREPRSDFVAGDDVVLRVEIDVPSGPMQAQVAVRASLRANVAGFKFKLKLPSFHVNVPDKQTREGIEGFADAEAKIPESFSLVKEATLKLPDMLPDSTYSLKAVATLKGFGDASCQQDVRITPD